MSIYDQIGALHDKTEKLVGVRYSVFDAGSDGPNWIEAVEMQFDNSTATVYVEPDFDTLRLELSEMKAKPGCHITVVSSVRPWGGALGRTLSWIWKLTNQQGYEDGLRFEFSSRERETPTVITLIGIASQIEVFVSQEISLWQSNR